MKPPGAPSCPSFGQGGSSLSTIHYPLVITLQCDPPPIHPPNQRLHSLQRMGKLSSLNATTGLLLHSQKVLRPVIRSARPRFVADLRSNAPIQPRIISTKSFRLYNLPITPLFVAACTINHAYVDESKDQSEGEGREVTSAVTGYWGLATGDWQFWQLATGDCLRRTRQNSFWRVQMSRLYCVRRTYFAGE